MYIAFAGGYLNEFIESCMCLMCFFFLQFSLLHIKLCMILFFSIFIILRLPTYNRIDLLQHHFDIGDKHMHHSSRPVHSSNTYLSNTCNIEYINIS